jgi:Icc-related predicted phosphoesterase
MKIFATSDIHGNRKIIDKLEHAVEHADMVIVCGDIGGKDFSRKDTLREITAGQKKDADRLIGKLRELAVPFRFILGNDDWFEHDDECRLKDTESISGCDLIPFEFVSITPFNTNREANENKLRYELNKMRAGERTVVVAHTPPYLCGDALLNGVHVGSRAVRDWIHDAQPGIWLCGHIHEDNSVSKIKDTLIFNCACDHMHDELRGWIIDTDSMSYEMIRM